MGDGGLFGGEDFDFDEDLLGELAHGHGAAGGEGGGERFGVNGVHGGEVTHVGKVDGGLHYVVHSEAGGFEDGLRVGETLAGLLGDPFGDFAGRGVDGNLAGGEHEGSAVDSLAVGADGAGGVLCGNLVLHFGLVWVKVIVQNYFILTGLIISIFLRQNF